MQRIVQLCVSIASFISVIAILVMTTVSPVKAADTLSPAAQRGFVLLREDCSHCHAIGRVGGSPLKIAPPFRTLHEHYPVEDLEEPLAEGILKAGATEQIIGKQRLAIPNCVCRFWPAAR